MLRIDPGRPSNGEGGRENLRRAAAAKETRIWCYCQHEMRSFWLPLLRRRPKRGNGVGLMPLTPKPANTRGETLNKCPRRHMLRIDPRRHSHHRPHWDCADAR